MFLTPQSVQYTLPSNHTPDKRRQRKGFNLTREEDK
jgi:hypothetical protein